MVEDDNGGRFFTATAASLFLYRRSVYSVTKASSSTISLQSRSFFHFFIHVMIILLHQSFEDSENRRSIS